MSDKKQILREEQFKKAQEYAKSRGGQCLSTQYITAKTKMTWKCHAPAHPQWESTFDSIVSRKSWCTQCGIEKNANRYKLNDGLEKAHTHAKKHGGLCLSTEYINMKVPMHWKCNNPEHKQWSSGLDHMLSRDSWCKQCAYDKAIIKNGYLLAVEYAKTKNGLCLTPSTEKFKGHSMIEWKCENSEHKSWKAEYRNIVIDGGWCPYCAGKFSNDEYLEIAKKLAISKGGQCLSNKYTGQKGVLLWQCKNIAHKPFKTNYQNVSTKNYWCHLCKDEEKEPSREEFLKKAKEHAKSRGGECLSTRYIGNDKKLLWKCDNVEHNPWEAKYSNVVGILQRWCPQCAGQYTKEEGLERAKEYAKSRNGECLSIEYIKSSKKLEWKCHDNNHKSWLSSYSSVMSKQTWCPDCGLYYKKEGKVKIILEMLLGFKLEKVKPKWNMNPKTNHALELDGYNEEHQFAFEFQGRHHFEENIFKNSDLATIQYKDKIKRKNCLANNVKLLAINDNTTTRTTSQLFKYIVKTLEENSISFSSKINIKQVEEKIKNSGIY